MRKLFLTIVLIMMSFGMSGCMLLLVGSGVAAGVGYAKGDLEATLDKPITAVYDASLACLTQMELPVIQKSQSLLDAEIIGRTSQDKKIRIVLKRKAENTTGLFIRIGTFGDEAHSRMIYDKIKENL